jgi:hypothetical protein
VSWLLNATQTLDFFDQPPAQGKGTEQNPALPRRLGNTGVKDSQPTKSRGLPQFEHVAAKLRDFAVQTCSKITISGKEKARRLTQEGAGL